MGGAASRGRCIARPARDEPKYETVLVTATVSRRDAGVFAEAVTNLLPVHLVTHSDGDSKEYTDLGLRFRMPIAAGIVTSAVQKAAAGLGGQVISIVETAPTGSGVVSVSGILDLPARTRASSNPSPPSLQEPAQRTGSERLDTRASGELYTEYWTKFSNLVARSELGFRPPAPSDRYYVRLSLRSSDMWINVFVGVRDRLLGVELVLKHPACDDVIARLKAARGEIEQALGQKLEWNERSKSVRLVLSERGYDPMNRADWDRQHARLIDQIKAYQKVLLGRLKGDYDAYVGFGL